MEGGEGGWALPGLHEGGGGRSFPFAQNLPLEVVNAVLSVGTKLVMPPKFFNFNFCPPPHFDNFSKWTPGICLPMIYMCMLLELCCVLGLESLSLPILVPRSVSFQEQKKKKRYYSQLSINHYRNVTLPISI